MILIEGRVNLGRRLSGAGVRGSVVGLIKSGALLWAVLRKESLQGDLGDYVIGFEEPFPVFCDALSGLAVDSRVKLRSHL